MSVSSATVTTLEQLVRPEIQARTPPELRLCNMDLLIVGAGGTGTWTAILAALSSDESVRFVIVDNDNLEISNLNRLPYPITWALESRNKAEALAAYLQYIRPNLFVLPVAQRIDTEAQLEILITTLNLDPIRLVIVDCTDNVRTQRLLMRFAAEKKVSYLGVHYDGESVTVEWIPAIEVEKAVSSDWIIDEQAQGYRVFPSVAYAPAFAAAMAVYLLAKRPPHRVLLTTTLRELVNKLTK